MTLQELKGKATASEATLIEATQKAIESEAKNEMKTKLLKFIEKYRPPSFDELSYSPNAIKEWIRKLNKHMEDEP